VKPLAKKYHYLADSGEFEGFAHLYPWESEQSQISLKILCTMQELRI